jgi:hypothetical protein
LEIGMEAGNGLLPVRCAVRPSATTFFQPLLGISMKPITALVLLSLLSIGCQSNRYSDRPFRSGGPSVNDSMLAYVPEAKRDAITKARTERSEMMDRVGIAERDLAQEKRRLDVAESELDISEATVKSAERTLEVARSSKESNRDGEIERANERTESARAGLRSAQSNIAYHKARIDQIESEVELAKLRVDLADARVELAKAKAVHDSIGPSHATSPSATLTPAWRRKRSRLQWPRSMPRPGTRR